MKLSFRISLFAVVLCTASGSLAPVFSVHAQDSTTEIESDISKLNKKLKAAETEKAALAKELSRINSSLTTAQKAIAAAKTRIVEATTDIERKQAEIDLIQERVEGNRIILGGLVREMQAESNEPLFSAVLSGEEVTRSLNDPDRLQSIGERMNAIIADIRSSQEQTVQEQQELERMKMAHEAALGDKLEEKQALASDQQETQADLAEQGKIISRLEKEIKELQNDLSALTGKSYNASDIRQAVEDASKETGVPEGVLYGFLKMETNLGANTGQCTYTEVEKVSVAKYKKYGSKYKASIAKLYERRDIFYKIVDSLGYNKDKKVSCSPSGYIGQGGAMGVSQFMSDVWKGYEAQISAKTGHSKPDPWSLTDGVMAMAIKLRKAGATSSKESAIRSASISYLGGFNANYFNGIVYWSKNYKLLFK
jgi:peptidoglycan hydrolase CwlO-like protein